MRTRLTALASLAALALAAAACSPSSSGDDSDSASSGGKTTVTVRIWDDQVQKSYEESFAAFTKANPDITVKINLVPYADYFTKLPLDVSSGDIDDIFWLNSSPFGQLADSGALMNIDKALPDEKAGWVKAAVDQYTRNGTLYGVPALTDGAHRRLLQQEAALGGRRRPEQPDLEPERPGVRQLPRRGQEAHEGQQGPHGRPVRLRRQEAGPVRHEHRQRPRRDLLQLHRLQRRQVPGRGRQLRLLLRTPRAPRRWPTW